MNEIDRFLGFSRMAVRLGALGVSWKIAMIQGKEPARFFYSLIYLPYAEKLGLKKGSVKERQLKKAVSAVTDFWFRTDALLDKESDYKSKALVADEKDQIINGDLNIDPSVPLDIQSVVREVEFPGRQKARASHFEFMAGFDPETSGFEEVMGYRENTTGVFAETVIRVINAVLGGNQDITKLIETIRRESLCAQMIDDLIDSVVDCRERLPNLFYGLLTKNPEEKTRFQAASFAPDVIRTKRPYDIAKFYTPKTLAAYMKIFEDMASQLPSQRRDFAKDGMAFVTRISFTPHSGVKGFSLLDIAKKMAERRTVIT